MPKLTLAPEFFKSELRNYANHIFAAIREFTQNAVDAGASRLDLAFEPREGRLVVTVGDDGRGMDRETLETVFFAMGRTTKGDGSTVGGFGKARILLCFAHASYGIRTRDVHAAGSGGDYEIEGGLPHREGCEFTVEMDTTDAAGLKERYLRELKRFVGMSALRLEITVDGEPYRYERLRKGKETRRFDWGAVHVTKSGRAARRGDLIVRVNGVAMFARSVDAPAMVVVELDPETSRDTLLSNRDSLQWSRQADLDAFVNEIARDKRSALETNTTHTEFTEGCARRFEAPGAGLLAELGEDERGGDEAPELLSDGGRLPEDVGEDVCEGTLVAALRETRAGETRLSEEGEIALPSLDDEAQGTWDFDLVPFGGEEDEDSRLAAPSKAWRPVHPLGHGLVYRLHNADAKTKKAAKDYHPSVWSARTTKLIAQWDIAVQAALGALCELGRLDGLDFRIGWVFSSRGDDGGSATMAQHETLPDGSHALLVNPLDPETARLRFEANAYASHARLLSLACHEVAHVCEGWHDEDFASLLTELVSRTMADMPALSTRMRRAR